MIKYMLVKSVKGVDCKDSLHQLPGYSGIYGVATKDINSAFRECEAYKKKRPCGCECIVKEMN